MTSLPPLLTTSEVAQRLGVDPRTVRRWVKANRIKSVRLPMDRTLRFRPEDVDAICEPEPA